MNLGLLQAQFPDLAGLRSLGAGGYKHVYSATHPQHGDVVLKMVVNPSAQAEMVRRETEAPIEVASARVPTIYNSGQLASGEHWVLEQRIIGDSLTARLRNGPLSDAEVIRLALQVSEVLRDAEAANIVHRDIKPDNIIIDGNGDFWVIDFGIARHLNLHSLTDSNALYGKCTPGYAPKEQMFNEKADIDSRSDLFALGVTIIEAATGANPFRQNAGRNEIVNRVQNMKLPRLQLQVQSQSEFADFVASLVAKRRDQRIRTAAEAHIWMQSIARQEGQI